MTAATIKDFEPIRTDYEFFELHSTEAEKDSEAFASHLQPFAASGRKIRLLDLGCGDGRFTKKLLQKAAISPDHLGLSLVEPVDEYRKQIPSRLTGFTLEAPELVHDISYLKEPHFDVIVANHSLYYVPRLSDTVNKLTKMLAPKGVLLISMAGSENFLVKIWERCFAELGIAVPYFKGDDLRKFLDETNAFYRSEQIKYELRFPDDQANKLKICRFLMGEYFQRVPIEVMLKCFRGYEDGDEIRVAIEHEHFIIRT